MAEVAKGETNATETSTVPQGAFWTSPMRWNGVFVAPFDLLLSGPCLAPHTL